MNYTASRPPRNSIKNQHKIHPYQSNAKQKKGDISLTRHGSINDPARDTGGFAKANYNNGDGEELLCPEVIDDVELMEDIYSF